VTALTALAWACVALVVTVIGLFVAAAADARGVALILVAAMFFQTLSLTYLAPHAASTIPATPNGDAP
jgi:cobalamin biosynthesis protein CobD/CbiB